MSERLSRNGLYPVDQSYWVKSDLRAQWDGLPKRPPLKGEYYLSGAIITAYKAPNDLSEAYHIARIVRVETVTVTRIVDADAVRRGR